MTARQAQEPEAVAGQEEEPEMTEETAETTPEETAAPRVVQVLAQRLNVRQEPNGAVVGTAVQGDQLEVLDEADGWLHTPQGYVMEKFTTE